MAQKKKQNNNADILNAFGSLLGNAARLVDALNQRPGGNYQNDTGERALPPQAQGTGIDPYQLLGLRANCSKEEFSARYRSLMKVYHPDSGAGDDTMAKLINMAAGKIKEMRGW